MGLLQKACETYDCHAGFVGFAREGNQILAPVSHIITSAQIEITVNQDGKFIQGISVDKSAPKIIIPVTEDSGGRTSAPCAHPLCDQLAYLAQYDEKKHALYVEQLTKWVQSEYSHPKLKPILNYVKGGTILSDLEQSGVIQLNDKGKPEKEKLLVCWCVIGLGDSSGPCWTDQSLFQSFIAYYSAQQKESEPALCMITGEMATPAKQHPKGIIPINGNAKLISANDKSGFTYRGRFTEEWQAGTVSYIASQKAHNALRWIAAEQGVRVVFGGRTFLCWNPQGKRLPSLAGPMARKNSEEKVQPTEYKDQLKRTLQGYQSELSEKNGIAGTAVIAAFDAATTGRLSLTYYNELIASDFVQRIHDWDEICCWWNGPYGVQSPPLWQIVDCAFGTQRTEKNKAVLKTDDKIMRQQMQRLISCRVDRAQMPLDIEKALVNRASTPLAYEPANRLRILFTACAVIRKYRRDTKKEVWEMALEPNKKDRSYQYGRLLAVMEKAERDTYDKEEKREPNAIRMQSVFCQRPQYAYRIVIEQLKKAYLPRLKPASRAFYDKLIGEILEKISQFPDDEQKHALEDTYLMGYYLQKNELYQSKKDITTEENENEHVTE